MRKHICLKAVLIALAAMLIAGCSKNNDKTLILWTDNVEFASYVELFNASQDEVKIATVYKTELVDALDNLKDMRKPDILAGSYLACGMQKKYYASLDKVFSDEGLHEEDFYSDLLKAGKSGKTQYLLPVSFNLGTFVCDISNKEIIDQDSTLVTFDQLKTYSKSFNSKTRENIYTKMGFAPQWNSDFLYMVLVANNVTFNIEKETLKYNIPLIEKCYDFLIEWTNTINTSSNDERDFAFKYLYTPFNKQVLQQKSLFAYTSSNKLLSLSEDQIDKVDFYWFCHENQSPVLEDMVMMGIYKNTKNKSKAMKFISWFMNEESQEAMIDRRISMNLDTNTFGIAGGFSSLIDVNEHVLPVYYKCLLAKIPESTLPKAPQSYPSTWPVIKKEIITPYLLNAVNGNKDTQGFASSYTNWINQNKED